jgi:hypothetical protein
MMMCPLGRCETGGVGVIKSKSLGHAGHQFHCGRVNVPAQAERYVVPMPKQMTSADSGWPLQKASGRCTMNLVMGVKGHANAVDQQELATFAKGNDRGGVVAPDDSSLVGILFNMPSKSSVPKPDHASASPRMAGSAQFSRRETSRRNWKQKTRNGRLSRINAYRSLNRGSKR